MASTYSFSDLLTYVGQGYPRLQQDAAGALLCDMVHSTIWAAADWRISLVPMEPFYLVALTQDYVAPYVNIPSNFLGLRTATLVYNGTEPASTYPPMKVLRYLPKTYAQSRPDSISWQSDINGFRIHPRCPSGIGVMDYQIECVYKKNPTKITTNTLETAIPFDDQYFGVYVEGMKYYLKPAVQQTPQDKMNFMQAIHDMASQEAFNLGEQPLSPAEPLVGW